MVTTINDLHMQIYIGALGQERMSLSLIAAGSFLIFLYLESEEVLLTTPVWPGDSLDMLGGMALMTC